MTTGVVIKRRPVHNIFKDVLWASVLAQKMPSGKWQSRVPLGIVMRQEISNPPLHRSVTEIKPIALGSVVSVVALLAVGTGYYVVVKNRSRQ
ncbi:hypothetical protein RRG08_014324 [Elysia crispata]|uniref:Uncharacterized protein n=1 Tax=Elysia crispata TaxID=231223 RepID=A0AAE0Z0K3_9GAST|nr:hypothetical protein RRG08_014324 [Elysia crispata]